MIDSSSLQKYSLFGGLLVEQINKILPLMEQEAYERDASIMVEGDRNDKIRFILEGRVAVIKEGVVLSELGEGDAFGEMEVLDIMPSAATIKALGTTRVMSISNRSLREVYRTDIKTFALILMNLARDLSRRLRRMDEQAAGRNGPPPR
jgi:CRP-like cAMP-binding protein